ncbi:MAG: hypothetical protein HGA85_06635, partial [Nanoarchaeota archaeon]|nr:hypothetical protein [Nanoarchaeota archaeon]
YIKKEDVKISITGLNPKDYGNEESFFIKDGIQEDILATYKDYEGNVIKATDIIVSFPGLSFKSKLSGNQPFPVQADVCYKYKTEAVSTGCIRKDPQLTNTKAVCVVNEEKKVFNSGAPVQVTSFLEQPSGTDKIRYLITIKHVGSGDVYSPATKCADKTVKNRVHVKIESSVTDLECVGFIGAAGKEGDVILRDGEYTFRCSQQKSSELDFEDRIVMTMTYDYLESVSTSVLVKKSS